MKKSVKIALHVCFWVLLLLTITFYDWAGQADGFFGLPRQSKSFFDVLAVNFNSLFVRPDIGSDALTLFNFLGILLNIFVIIYQPFSLVMKLSPTKVLNNSVNTF